MAEQRLPTVGGDDGSWGTILNQFLEKEHYNTGSDNASNGMHKGITVRAGSTSVAPLTFTTTSASLLTTPAAGSLEMDSSGLLYYTQTTGSGNRRRVMYYDASAATTGDIFYRNSGGDVVRLGIGSSNQVLTVNSGLPSWQPASSGSPGGSSGQVQYNSSGSFGGAAGITYQTGASPNVTITAQNAAHVPLVVSGAASQTADILQLKDGGGNTIVSSGSTSADGVITVSGTAPDITGGAGVRITSLTNSTTLSQYGMWALPSAYPASASTGRYVGFGGGPYSDSANLTTASFVGAYAAPYFDGGAGKTLGIAMGLETNVYNNSPGTINTVRSIYVNNPTNNGTITDNYGILVNPQTAGTNDYGVAIGAADTQTLWISNNANNSTAVAGIAFGSSRDTNLYRSAADTLATDDDINIKGGKALKIDGSGSGTVSVKTAAAAGTWTMTVPTGTGSSGQFLQTDGAGVTSWQNVLSLSWTEVTGTSQSASVNNGYITNNASLVTVTLPTTAALGDMIRVVGKGAGGWKLAQNASQKVYFGNATTTTGTGGYLQNVHARDAVTIVCVTANNDWEVIAAQGNITYV